MNVCARIKVKGQEIYGKIVRIHPSKVVILDEDLNAELCFKLTEVEDII